MGETIQGNASFTANFDISNVIAGVNKIQNALKSLKLPDKMQTEFNGLFNKFDNNISKIQTAMKSGFKSGKDVTGLSTAFKDAETILNKIQLKMAKIDSSFVPQNWTFTSGEEMAKFSAQLDEAEKKVKNFWSNFQTSATVTGVDGSLKTVKDTIQDISNATQKLGKNSKIKEAFENLTAAFNTNDFDKVKEAIAEVETAWNRIEAKVNAGAKIDSITNEHNGWQKIKDVKNIFDTLKTSIDGANYDKAVIDLNNLKTKISELSQQDLSKLMQSVPGLSQFLHETAQNMGQVADSTFKTNQQFDMFKSRLQYFFGLNNALNLIKRTLREAFNTVKELDTAMTETAVVTSYTVEDMWGRLPEYTKMANKLGTTTLGAYQTATLYYQQGLNTTEAMAVSTETMKMARIGGLEYADATDMMTAALRGFNMEINETSARQVNDVYSELAAITAANTEEIATAMTKTASIANSANMEFGTTSAFLSQIIETTREAPETAGTAMKTIIARFAEVKKLVGEGSLLGEDEEGTTIDINKIDTALKTVGMSLNKFIAGEEGLDDVLLRLAGKWDTLSLSTQRYIATQAAGSRQQSRFIAMMSDYDRTMELVNAAENSAGAGEEQFEKTLDSLESKLNSLSNAWNEFAMGIANSAVIKTGVEGLTGLLNIVNNITGAFGDAGGAILKLGLIIGGLNLGKNLLGMVAAGGSAVKNGSGTFLQGMTTSAKQLKANRQNSFLGQVYGKEFSALKTSPGKLLKSNLIDKNNNIQFKNIDKIGAQFGGKTWDGLKENEDKIFESYKKQLVKQYSKSRTNKTGQKLTPEEKTAIEARAQKQSDKVQEAYNSGKRSSSSVSKTLSKAGVKDTTVKGPSQEEVKSIQVEKTIAAQSTAAMGLAAIMGIVNGAIQNNANASDELKEGISGVTTVITILATVLMILPPILTAIGGAAQAAMGVIGWIAIAIAAVVSVIIAIAASIESAEEKTERLKEQVTEAASRADEAKSAYDNLLSFQSSHNTLLEELSKLTVGTQAFTSKLIEANAAAIDLMNKYSGLAQGMKIGENGEITFLDEAWQTVISDQQKIVQAAQKSSIGAQLALEQDSYSKIEQPQTNQERIYSPKKEGRTPQDIADDVNALGELFSQYENDFIQVFGDQANRMSAKTKLKLVDLAASASEKTDKELNAEIDYILREDYYYRYGAGHTLGFKNWKKNVKEYGELNPEGITYNDTPDAEITNQQRISLLKQQQLAASLYTQEALSEGIDSNLANTIGELAAQQIDQIDLDAEKSKSLKGLKDASVDTLPELQNYYKALVGITTLPQEMMNYSITDMEEAISSYEAVQALTGSDSVYQDYVDQVMALDGTAKKAAGNYKDYNIYELKEALGDISYAEGSLGEAIMKQYETAMKNSSIDLMKTVANKTNVALPSGLLKDIDPTTIDKINTVVSSFGNLFDKDTTGEAFSAILEHTTEGSYELLDALNGINYNNAIDSLYQLKNIQGDFSDNTKKELAVLYQDALSNYGSNNLLQSLVSSDAFAEIQTDLDELMDTSGEISADNILELADSCELLEQFLDLDIANAGTLADVLTSVQLGETGVEDFTEDLLKAMNVANLLESKIAEAFQYVDSHEWARSEQDIADEYVGAATGILDHLKAGDWGDSEFEDMYSTLFGNDNLVGLQELVSDYYKNGGEQEGLLDYIKTAEDGKYAAQLDALTAMEESNDIQPLVNQLGLIGDSDTAIFTELTDGVLQLKDEKITTTADLIGALDDAGIQDENLQNAILAWIAQKSPDIAMMLGKEDAQAGLDTFNQKLKDSVLLESELQTYYEQNKGYLDELYNSDGYGSFKENYLDRQHASLKQIIDLEKDWSKGEDGYTNLKNALEASDSSVKELLSGSTKRLEINPNWDDTELDQYNLGELIDTGEKTFDSLDVDSAVAELQKLGATQKEAEQIVQDYADANDAAVSASVKVWEDGAYSTKQLMRKEGESIEEFRQRVQEFNDEQAAQQYEDQLGNAIANAITKLGAKESGIQTEINSLITFEPVNAEEVQSIYNGFVDKTVIITFKSNDQTGGGPGGGGKGGKRGTGGGGKGGKGGTGPAAGTAQVSGSSYVQGTWGTGTGSQTALTGELGQEIVVDPHSGRWHTVGDNGAEFTKLPKDAIVFNHLQTKGLLQNRKIFGRGKALAGGNAFVSGNAYDGGTAGVIPGGLDWRGTDASKKTGSGGGGSKSGDEKEWTNELDEQYNTLERIEKITRDREKLEEELERIYEKGAALDNFKEQKSILEEIIDKQTKLIDIRKQELDEFMSENEKWKDYAVYDPNLDQVVINWEKIDALSGEEGEEFDDYFDELEERFDRLVDAEDGQVEVLNDLKDLIDDLREKYFDIEERVMDAVLAEVQSVIDRLSGINDAINDSNTKLIESMQKTIDDERELRENEDTEKEIADRQAQLALLSRDTSGTYATEIKELTKEIEDLQEDYTDTLVDQAIQNLQDQYDLAAEERERNIELLENQKDFREENGKYWSVALKILSGNETDLEAYLMMYDEEYKKASPEDQLKMLEEMKNEYANGMAWYYEHGQNNIATDIANDKDSEKAGRQYDEGPVDTGETEWRTENGKQVEYKKQTTTTKTEYYNPDGSTYYDVSQDEAVESWVTTGNTKEIPVATPTTKQTTKQTTSRSSGGGYTYTDSSGKQVTVKYLSKVPGFENQKNGKITTNSSGNVTGYKGGSGSGNFSLKKKDIIGLQIKKNATGGLNDTTGLAWLDGTFSKPELVLNPGETQDFLEFIKTFRELESTGLTSQNNGENYFDIHIEVDSLGSDYDTDQMVDEVISKISEKASYRNVNIVSNFRR